MPRSSTVAWAAWAPRCTSDTGLLCCFAEQAAEAVRIVGHREVSVGAGVDRLPSGLQLEEHLAEEPFHQRVIPTVGHPVEVDQTAGGISTQDVRFLQEDGAGSCPGGGDGGGAARGAAAHDAHVAVERHRVKIRLRCCGRIGRRDTGRLVATGDESTTDGEHAGQEPAAGSGRHRTYSSGIHQPPSNVRVFE